MKVTRRSLAQVLAISASLPHRGFAQDRTGATAASGSDAVSAAREEYRAAGRALAAVKIPRSLEPATRFEA